MDTGELSGLLKRLCKVCWIANVTNPITYVTQISYLRFLKMLEEWDAQAEQDVRDIGKPRRSLFEGECEAMGFAFHTIRLFYKIDRRLPDLETCGRVFGGVRRPLPSVNTMA